MVRMSTTVSCTCSCVLLVLILFTGSQAYVRFCYFSNWAQFRVNASFTPLDIDPSLCTHILYSFGALENNTIRPIEYNDYTLYSQINSLKEVNPELKILLAIGGWDANNTHFTHLVSSDEFMDNFSETAIGYLRDHKFDGLDIDWEYPAGRGGPSTDTAGFTVLLQKLRTAFEEEANDSKLPRLLLTAAVVAPIQQAENYYQIDQIGRYLDYINIMTYDFHGSWERTTGIHSALYTETNDSVNGWVRAGAPKEKLVVGVAAYGRTYTLASPSDNPPSSGINQPAIGPGMAGPSTESNGSLAYFEICELLARDNWTEIYSVTHDSPVAYGRVGNTINWVGYDNIRSVRAKAKYIRDRGLAGAVIWSLDQDDFQNRCGDSRFPLASALLEQLPSDGEVPGGKVTTTAKPDTTTVETTTTKTTEKQPSTITTITTTATAPTTTTNEPTKTTVIKTTKAAVASDDSSPTDPGWVTTTPSPTTTSSTTGTTPPTTGRPRIKPPRIPFSRPVSPDRCRVLFEKARPHSMVRGNPRMFVAANYGMFSIFCTCPRNYVYNPCIKSCDYKTNRATCMLWL